MQAITHGIRIAGVAVLLVAGVALAVVLVRFNLKRRYIARCAAAASVADLERVYALIDQQGNVAPAGYVLARTNQRSAETRCIVPIPADLDGFPWAGQAIEVKVSKDVELEVVPADVAAPVLLGKVYRPVRVPRHAAKAAGKERNTFSPNRLVAGDPGLVAALQAICPRYPQELLAYLLCVGRNSFEFEPIDQARIGTSAAWAQGAELPTCDECRKRMQLVLQLPGTLVSTSQNHRGTFYLFGCGAHSQCTRVVRQFT